MSLGPVLGSGRLDLSDGTFRQMARAHPAVAPMRELRSALSDMRLADLAVGSDGRNRTILSAFPIAHRTLPAEQYQIHFWAQCVAAQPDPATGRLRRRLH